MGKTKIRSIYGIAFDLEGTIIDIEAIHHTAHLNAAKDAGVSLTWEEACLKLPHFIGGPDDKVAEDIAKMANKKTSSSEILQNKLTYFNKLLLQTKEILPRDGFLNFLNWVKSNNIKFALGSVTNKDQIEYLLRKSYLSQSFPQNQIISREDVIFPKPNPEVYFMTAHLMGILPSNQLVIEDSLVGVRSAKAAGCRIVAVPTITADIYIDLLINEGVEEVFKSWKDPNLISFITSSLPKV